MVELLHVTPRDSGRNSEWQPLASLQCNSQKTSEKKGWNKDDWRHLHIGVAGCWLTRGLTILSWPVWIASPWVFFGSHWLTGPGKRWTAVDGHTCHLPRHIANVSWVPTKRSIWSGCLAPWFTATFGLAPAATSLLSLTWGFHLN